MQNDDFGKMLIVFICGMFVLLIALIIIFGRMSIENKKKCELAGGYYSSSRYDGTLCLKKDSIIEKY